MNNNAFNREKINRLTRAAAIAALYAVLTIALAPLSFNIGQFRVSEALTVLPVLLPEAIPGLALGCLISKLYGSATVWDVVFGTFATLLAAALTRLTRRNMWLALVWPVLCNGVIVGLVLALTGGMNVPLTMAQIAFEEAVVVFALGPLLLRALKAIPPRITGGRREGFWK